MADHVLERRLWLPRPRPEVFAFFADPDNLTRVTAPSAHLRWVVPPPSLLAAGAVLDFRIRQFGVPVRWRVFVREFDPPHRFVDAQLWGPFARWEHRHCFVESQPDEPIGTWVEDRVTYRLPLGGVGRLVHALGAGRRIARVFDYRERRLKVLLGAVASARPSRCASARAETDGR